MPRPTPSARRKRPAPPGVMVIVAYRPKAGKAAALLRLARVHVDVLRGEGLATRRPAAAMRAADGTLLEVFEWRSAAAMAAAHSNPAVLRMWKKYAQVCDYVPVAHVAETASLFASFAPVSLS